MYPTIFGNRASWLSAFLILVICIGIAGWIVIRPTAPGAVVESCEAAETADRAGLEPGDVIREWRQGKTAGIIDSSLSLELVELLQAPFGPIELGVKRGWRSYSITLPTGRWRMGTRPTLSTRDEDTLEYGRQAIEQGRPDSAVALFDEAAIELETEDRPLAAAWFRLQSGTTLMIGEHHNEAMTQLDKGAALGEDPIGAAAFWAKAGSVLLAAGRRTTAAECFNKALLGLEILSPEIGKKAEPMQAHLLLQLCRTNMRTSESKAETAVDLYRKNGGRNLELADALKVLGTTQYYQEDWDAAKTTYEKGLEIAAEVAPQSPSICESLGNLGLVAHKTGDFDQARRFFTRDLNRARLIGSPPKIVGYAANYLGLVSRRLGLYEEARRSYEHALTAFRSLRPGGIEEAGVLNNLGGLAIDEYDNRAALVYHQAALEIRRAIHPGGESVASSLNNLGVAQRRLGLFNEAKESLERSLVIKRKLAPGSWCLSNTLSGLGLIAQEQGLFEAADAYHREALHIRSEVSPQHPMVAEAWFSLGLITWEQGLLEEAESSWRKAINIIEQHRKTVSASEDERSRFGSRFFDFYSAMAHLLVEKGNPLEAFELTEHARAGALRAQLASRKLGPGRLPEESKFEMARLIGRIESIERRRSLLNPAVDSDRIAELSTQLHALNDRMLQIRDNSQPALLTMQPSEVTVDAIRRALDPGTVVLSFVLMDEQSLVFSVGDERTGPSLRAHRLSFGRKELQRRISVFRALVARGGSSGTMEPALVVQATRLFDDLLRPTLDAIAPAERLLIVADEPLAELPFSALYVPEIDEHWLGHWKPLVFNPSAGVATRHNGSSRNQTTYHRQLVAFGDPFYAPRSQVVQDLGLVNLPGSRNEVEGIAAVFGDTAQIFMGKDATEEQVKNHGLDARIVHFAVHSVPDRHDPLESALMLSLPANPKPMGEDGVLKAWEIIDQVPTDAAIVTLSACGTARGRNVAGEGVLGLARAFRYAGARTVVVSQWPVSDQSTATLMKDFYTRLLKGVPTSNALQQSQRFMATTEGSPHPYHWAAFQVIGDWQ